MRNTRANKVPLIWSGETGEQILARVILETAPPTPPVPVVPKKRSAPTTENTQPTNGAIQNSPEPPETNEEAATDTRAADREPTEKKDQLEAPMECEASEAGKTTDMTLSGEHPNNDHPTHGSPIGDTITVTQGTGRPETISSKDDPKGASSQPKDEQRAPKRGKLSTKGEYTEPQSEPPKTAQGEEDTIQVKMPAKKRKQATKDTDADFGTKPEPKVAAKTGGGKRRSSDDPMDAVSQEEPRRSGRSRAAPKDIYVESMEQEKSKAQTAKPKLAVKGRGKAAATGRGRKKMNLDQLFSPDVVASKKSPWVEKIDISAVFSKDFMENVLTAEQREKVISWLPPSDITYVSEPKDGSNPDLNPQIDHKLWGHSVFKDALANWRQDLSEGKYEKGYIEKGLQARRRRMAGEFDSWKDEQFELFWGQKQRMYSGAIAAESSKVKLETLIKHGAFKIGDIFSTRRGFHGGVVVRKEAKFVSVTDDNLMSFSYPPGRNEWEKKDVESKIIEKVDSMTKLENAMMKEDGRAPNPIPNGNAFKTMRIIRKGEDIGSIFDVRAKFYQQYLKSEDDD